MITKRDQRVIEYIEKFKVATTDTIAELFYPSIKVAQRRLREIAESKLLKRDRDHFTAQYYYYTKKNNQLRHSLLLTDFYRELNKIATIEHFDNEFVIGELRADGLVVYKINGTAYVAFVEVQIANTPVDIAKYEKLHKSTTYKNFFPVFPLIIAITNKKIPSTNLKVIQVNEDIENLRGLLI